MKTKQMILAALFAAITAVCAQITVPTPPVPFTMAIAAVLIAGGLLDKKTAIVSMCIYLLIGIVGAPVFTGFRGGISVIAGPTGGYLFVYPVMAFVIAFLKEKFGKTNFLTLVIPMVIAMVICYASGTLYLSFVNSMTFGEALAAGVIPFLIPDAVKVVVSALLVIAIEKALKKYRVSVKN